MSEAKITKQLKEITQQPESKQKKTTKMQST